LKTARKSEKLQRQKGRLKMAGLFAKKIEIATYFQLFLPHIIPPKARGKRDQG
jgi:hypothetical protein